MQTRYAKSKSSNKKFINMLITRHLRLLAEGVGFEPTVELPLLLISSQMPLTTQPPFQPRVPRSHGAQRDRWYYDRNVLIGKPFRAATPLRSWEIPEDS